MSIFKKSGYLRVLFIGLPFGVASLLGGIQIVNDIPDTPKDLKLHEGKLVSYGDAVYYSKAVDLERSVFYLKVIKKSITPIEEKNEKL
ncbi:hypothetical protein [Alkalitalea saponilacus]|uniref:Uncharacterized protein n=1 Tax=Alkalitalea saponilacus TaxID=889453 RepID=A0A1T5F4N5_9BACT|nr:hypothetical protein [Alkalitalea saponilacus]ASB50178.1 hypothetical protein CDL62_14045 [Alkalitalea saponilacus]SKB91089.1 hypothetical protein SAMN03080601_01473 [Alkalitalea saponilacus]